MKPSPASSIRSGSATPNSQPPIPHGQQQHSQHPHSGFGHLLRHMFETPRHASFAVSVTLHELSNVPQISGNFAVRWKFRGHRPHDADKMLENPQKRIKPVDNIKPPGAKGLRGSSSFQSLRSTSSASVAPSANSSHSFTPRSSSGLVPARTAGTPHPPSHANTLPTSVVSHSATSIVPHSATNGNVVDLAPESDDNISGPPSAPSSRAPSTYSVSSSLSVPGQSNRSLPGTSASRAGTAPPALALDPAAISRPASRATSVQSDNSGMEPLTPMTMASTQSGAQSIMEGWPSPDSTSRKGVTPMCEVRAHSVGWEYQVQDTIRVMLGKSGGGHGRNGKTPTSPTAHGVNTPGNGTRTPSGRTLPRLGEGPMSDSGLKLEILQANGKGKDNVLFGYVNIDLAPFADLGSTARRFLLKDSKTNATIRVTVDMRYIGGEQEWVAPPLTDGHLVTSVAELAGEEAFPDLQLLPTRSYSSDSAQSSVSRPSQRSGTSAISLTKQPAAQTASIAAQTTKHRYKTFEHHLRPEHSIKHRQRTASGVLGVASVAGMGGRSSTIETASTSSASWPRVIGNTDALVESPASSPLLHPSEISPTSTKAPSSYFERSRQSMEDSFYDRYASGYQGGTVLSPIQTEASSSPLQPSILSPTLSEGELRSTSPEDLLASGKKPNSSYSPSPSSVKHHHHRSYHRDSRRGSEDLQADLVIESVFNPRAGEEISPFTYIPAAGEVVEEESSDASALQLDLDLDVAPEENVQHSRRWGRLRRKVASAHRAKEAAAALA